MRRRISGLFLLCTGITGVGHNRPSVTMVPEYVFRDLSKVGMFIGIYLLFVTLASADVQMPLLSSNRLLWE